jgi:flagellar hook protein FlgE
VAKTNNSYTRQIAFTAPVSPDDDNDLPLGPTRALMVGTDGDVVVQYENGTTDTLYLLAGMVHPISVARVLLTGTDATLIKAGY